MTKAPAGPARRTGFVECDGERIYYEDLGAGAPLVLCHGAGGNHAVWMHQVASFTARRRVVCFDHRGFGRSTDRAGRGGPECAVADLEALLDHLELPRVDLVGQSMGGWTALGLAAARPERVRSLVLADTLGGLDSPEIDRLRQRLRRGAAAPEADGRLGQHPALHPSFAERDPAHAWLYQALGGFGEPDLGRVLPRLLAHRVPDEARAALTMPVLFVVGEHDPLFPPPVVRAAADLLTDARIAVVPGCGHSPYFEEPDVWNAIVGRFLEEEDDLDEEGAGTG